MRIRAYQLPRPPGIRPEMPPVQMPTIVITVLFTAAVAAGKYELAGALGTLLGAFASQKT